MVETTVKLPGERWGRKRKDNRNWPEYNEELVIRGTFFLDFGIFKDWDKELKRMNRHKMGGRYIFPESFIKWEAVWKQLIDYRGLEGITRKLEEAGLIPQYNDYTTIWHRIHNFKPEITLPNSKRFGIASDGTGLKTDNSGEYMRQKYGRKRKKYVVVVITADKKRKKLLDVDVHIEGEGETEPQIARKHIEKLKKKGKRVTSVAGDGAFDTHSMFGFLDKNNIRSSIKIRRKSVTYDYVGLPFFSKRRVKEVKKYQRLGYRKWAKKTDYGDRWPATEGIFSAVKRKFGENVVSSKKENVIAEALQRFWAYDTLQMFGRETASIL